MKEKGPKAFPRSPKQRMQTKAIKQGVPSALSWYDSGVNAHRFSSRSESRN